jgi:outer membrane lipoprotein-sorting protein
MKGWCQMHFMLMPVLLVALTQDSNQAEKAFRASEKKLTEADTAQITVNATMKSGVQQFTMKGTLLLAKGNKARIDFTGDTPGGGFKLTSVTRRN